MKRYSIIYADPPWSYHCKNVQGAANKHYPVMSIEDLCNLPVGELAEKDSVLFLWATSPLLPEALRLMEAWGFKYKTCAFTWVKQYKNSKKICAGLGWWTLSGTEFCLLGTRGKPKRVSKSVKQVIVAPREEHSKKPDEVRERIVQLMGDLPRIELFARKKEPGWDVFGNEVDSDIDLSFDVIENEGGLKI